LGECVYYCRTYYKVWCPSPIRKTREFRSKTKRKEVNEGREEGKERRERELRGGIKEKKRSAGKGRRGSHPKIMTL
jgi:hypothetical protein